MGTTAGTTYVSSAAELQSALASATAGTTILLASGNYGASVSMLDKATLGAICW